MDDSKHFQLSKEMKSNLRISETTEKVMIKPLSSFFGNNEKKKRKKNFDKKGYQECIGRNSLSRKKVKFL